MNLPNPQRRTVKALQRMLCLLSVGLASHSLKAHDKHKHEHGNHQAHVHGVAELQMVQTGETIELILHSPLGNLVGFEHLAKTKQEISELDKAAAILKNSEQLLTFKGGDCQLRNHHNNVASKLASHTKHRQQGHQDISASYAFQCTKPASIEELKLGFFKHFPAIERIKMQWINEQGQGAASLSQQKTVVHFN